MPCHGPGQTPRPLAPRPTFQMNLPAAILMGRDALNMASIVDPHSYSVRVGLSGSGLFKL